MIIITHSTPKYNGTGIARFTWHTGQTIKVYAFPEFRVNGIRPNHILSISADGNELEFVKTNFNNLPCPKNARAVDWSGDMAKLIFQCLPKDYSRFPMPPKGL